MDMTVHVAGPGPGLPLVTPAVPEPQLGGQCFCVNAFHSAWQSRKMKQRQTEGKSLLHCGANLTGLASPA
jgi:hypothetical protein